MSLKIKNGAICIADAHENDKRDYFYDFLKKIENKEIKTTQLFLMGDMFDLLVGKVKYTVVKYKKYIDLIDKIALHVEVFYFEGNHDFSLENIFENVKVFPIEKQPMIFTSADNSDVILSHGDKYGDFLHMLYTRVIRLKPILVFLNFIDTNIGNKISKKIINDLLEKKICLKIDNFEQKIKNKISKYKVKNEKYIVEGHYHQNKKFDIDNITYINFSSFACNQSYFIVNFQNSANSTEFAEKQLRGCNV